MDYAWKVSGRDRYYAVDVVKHVGGGGGYRKKKKITQPMSVGIALTVHHQMDETPQGSEKERDTTRGT